MRDEMRAYLDAPMDRRGTNCEKWDGLERHFGRPDLVAMWVADMDFPTVPQVSEAIIRRAGHAVYGYTDNSAQEKEAEIGWLRRRHGLDVDPDWMFYSPGVVDSIGFCIEALTRPGDGVLVQPPVYGPFYDSQRLYGRTLVQNPLIHGAEGWRMDFDDLERKLSQGVKLVLLCSPHNPVGRVWTRDELQQLVDMTREHGAVLVSDEIHAEFTLDGRRQVRILTLDGVDHCVMLTSATKAFNLAGLRHSSIIAPSEALREPIKRVMRLAHATSPNIFGSIAQTEAYRCGDEWMDAVVEYIQENRDYAVSALAERLPQIGCEPQQGTYLMWLDLSRLGMEHEELKKFLVDRAHVAMNDGLFFGEACRGWFRMNLATQRANVVKTIDNLCEAIRSL